MAVSERTKSPAQCTKKIPEQDHLAQASAATEVAETSSEIARLLQQKRPKLIGSPSDRERQFIQLLNEEAKLNETTVSLADDDAFLAYLGRMARNISHLSPLEERAGSAVFRAAFLRYVAAEFEMLRTIGVSRAIIKFHGHTRSASDFNKVRLEAIEIFGSGDKAANFVGRATRMVWLRNYPSIAAAKAAYDRFLKDSEYIFGRDPALKGCVKTAAYLVWRQNYRSVQAAKEAKDQIQQGAQTIFGGDATTAGLAKTAAFLVWNRIYLSLTVAKATYDAALKDAVAVFGNEPSTVSLTRTAAFSVWLKQYHSIKEAMERYITILADAEELFSRDTETAPLVRTAAYLVWCNHYRTLKAAKRTYEVLLTKSEASFGPEWQTAEIVRSAVYLVWRKYYPSISAAKLAYDTAIRETNERFGQDELTTGIVRTIASLVWQKQYQSAQAARETFDVIVSETEGMLSSDESTRPMAIRVAKAIFCGVCEDLQGFLRLKDHKLRDRVRLLRVRAGELPSPALEELDLDDCLKALSGIFTRVGQVFSLALGKDDAESEAKLAAILLLRTGERDVLKITDGILYHVDRQAAKESNFHFSQLPLNEAILYRTAE